MKKKSPISQTPVPSGPVDRINPSPQSTLRTRKLPDEDDQRLKEAVADAAPGIAELDGGAGFVNVNDRICGILGLSRGDVIGKILHELDLAEDRMHTRELMSALRDGGREMVSYDRRRLRPDGASTWLHVTLSAMRDPGGVFLRAIAVVEDISGRKQTEETLLKYSLAVEQSPASIVITSTDGTIEYVNPKFTEVNGYTPEEVLGENPRVLKSGLTPADTYRDMWRTLGDEREWRGEFINRRKDGTLYWEIASISPVRNSEGIVTHYVAVKEDITRRKRAEEEIRALNQELERRVEERTAELQAALKELEEFSYSIGHDLRAPLRAINSFATIVLEDNDGKLDSHSKRHLHNVVQNGNMMGRLVDELLAFSRLSRAELRMEPVDMNLIARSVVETLKSNEPSVRRIEVTIHDLPPARGSEALIKEALAHLIANAFKFTRTKPEAKVEIGCRLGDGEDTFFVKDNGIGFQMQYAEKVWGVFERLHTPDEYEGTGIGLALVKRIVERHGGRVSAEAIPGEGATFFLSLPR